jgi:hypothetical protein
MKNIIQTLLIFGISFTLAAQSNVIKQQTIDSKIENVTVFLSSAQVYRTATTTLSSGKTELVFRGLTPSLDPESIQIQARGEVSILSIRNQLNFLEEVKQKDTLKQIRTQLEKLEEKTKNNRIALAVLEYEEGFLNENKKQIVGVQNNISKLEDLKQNIDFQRFRLTEILTKKAEISSSNAEIQKENTKLNAQERELSSKISIVKNEIIVTVFVKNTVQTSVEFSLSYVVPNAAWYPLYDLRVRDIQSPIQAQMKAKVRQNSGEDWSEIKLSLSTGEPKLTGTKPELGVWYIEANGRTTLLGRTMNTYEDLKLKSRNIKPNTIRGIVRDGKGEPIPFAIIYGKEKYISVETDFNGQFELRPDDVNSVLVASLPGFKTQEIVLDNQSFIQIVMEENGTSVEQVMITSNARSSGKPEDRKKRKDKKSDFTKSFDDEPAATEIDKLTTTTFEIVLPSTVLSQNKEQVVDIKELSMPANYQYTVVPKLDLDAFLTAVVPNVQELNLLDGEAQLYFEGMYMGKTYLSTRQTTDTLNISLGRDRNIVVSRTKIKDFGSKALFSKKKTQTRQFEIVVKNKKALPINLTIEEQIPIAKDAQIEIEHKAEAAEFEPTKGLLIWKMNLKSQEERKTNFKYAVKHPENLRIDLE